jgi:two-component system, chemotaxis family, chemotaxis protein CheY
MFSKQELQIIGKTLAQRREWLLKAIQNPDYAANKSQNEMTLQVIESAMSKIDASQKTLGSDNPAKLQNSAQAAQAVNHYISSKATSSIRQLALKRRLELDPTKIRVLLVDDDQFICDLVSAFLMAMGIEQIDMANDGMKAINMLYEANPVYDLVLCDWNMPNKSGLEVHNAMRAAERYHGAVFILVTGVTEAKQIRAAIDEGVDDYVVKPIEQDKLLKKIKRFFPNIVE